jgi:transcriptional regulator with XRE-family HTH domain
MGIKEILMENMRKYRKEAKLTQEKLAELCDTDSVYIGQIENGRRFPSLLYVERIATALKIPPFLLFFEEKYAFFDGNIIITSKKQRQTMEKALIEGVSDTIRTLINKTY